MKTPEQKLISGSVQFHTPGGTIELSFRVNVTEGTELLNRCLGQLLNPSSALLTPSKTAVLEGDQISASRMRSPGYIEMKRKWSPLFTLVPDEELGPLTSRAVGALEKSGIDTIEALAVLTDQEVKEWRRGAGFKVKKVIQHLRDLAQNQLQRDDARQDHQGLSTIPADDKPKTSKFSEALLRNYEERRRRDPIFALVPLQDVVRHTLRTAYILRRSGIESLEKLAALTDSDVAEWRGGAGPKTKDYIRYLRDLAQKHLTETGSSS